jgi:hypothetical protein
MAAESVSDGAAAEDGVIVDVAELAAAVGADVDARVVVVAVAVAAATTTGGGGEIVSGAGSEDRDDDTD